VNNFSIITSMEWKFIDIQVPFAPLFVFLYISDCFSMRTNNILPDGLRGLHYRMLGQIWIATSLK